MAVLMQENVLAEPFLEVATAMNKFFHIAATIIYDTVPRRVTPLHSLEIIYFVRIHVHYLMPFKGSTQTIMQFDPRWHCNSSPLGQK